MSVAWVGVGVAAAGTLMQADAAGNAAGAQSDAAAASNLTQRYMYDRNVELQMPTINAGNAARDRLTYLLGLSPTGSAGKAGLTYDQLRQELVGQYTRYGNGSAGTGSSSGPIELNPTAPSNLVDLLRQANAQIYSNPSLQFGPNDQNPYAPWGQGGNLLSSSGGSGQTSYIDEAGLDAEIRRRLAQQDAERQAAIDAANRDPLFGSLAQQYTPNTFSFSNEDFFRDPSYEWRLSQGQKALDRAGAAAGSFLSGKQLQAASDYNQGAASQEYGAAYGRAADTFDRNENNRFNAYQANFTNTINPLLSLAGSGQVTAQYLGNSGSNYASAVGNNLTGAANATGAAGIATANNVSSGLSNALNGYQQNSLLNSFLNRSSVNNNPGYSGTFVSSPMGNTYGY